MMSGVCMTLNYNYATFWPFGVSAQKVNNICVKGKANKANQLFIMITSKQKIRLPVM